MLHDPILAFVACIRAGSATGIAIGTAMVWLFAPPAASAIIAKPLVPLLIVGCVLGPAIISTAPSSPVAWVVVLGPLCAALLMPPRWVASIVLAMTAAAAFYNYPWYVTGQLSWFPPQAVH